MLPTSSTSDRPSINPEVWVLSLGYIFSGFLFPLSIELLREIYMAVLGTQFQKPMLFLEE
jgi:hypothetical protein